MQKFHIAEINVALLRVPLSDPLLSDFVAELDRVNAVADASPGFVWRLKGADGGSSSYLQPFPNERMIINMSVWTSIEALRDYVYRSDHVEIFRKREKWFERIVTPLALWWVPSGTIPSVTEGVDRLARLVEAGPTPEAFTFKKQFPAAASSLESRSAVSLSVRGREQP